VSGIGELKNPGDESPGFFTQRSAPAIGVGLTAAPEAFHVSKRPGAVRLVHLPGSLGRVGWSMSLEPPVPFRAHVWKASTPPGHPTYDEAAFDLHVAGRVGCDHLPRWYCQLVATEADHGRRRPKTLRQLWPHSNLWRSAPATGGSFLNSRGGVRG